MEEIDSTFQALLVLSDSLLERGNIYGSIKCLEAVLQSKEIRFLPEMIATSEYKLSRILLQHGTRTDVDYAKRLTDNAIQYYTGKNVVLLEKEIIPLLLSQRIQELCMLNHYSLIITCIKEGLVYSKQNNFIYWEGFFLLHYCIKATLLGRLEEPTKLLKDFIQKCKDLGDMVPETFLLVFLIEDLEMTLIQGEQIDAHVLAQISNLIFKIENWIQSGRSRNFEYIEDEYLREFEEAFVIDDLSVLRSKYCLLVLQQSYLSESLPATRGKIVAFGQSISSGLGPITELKPRVILIDMEFAGMYFTMMHKYFATATDPVCSYEDFLRDMEESLSLLSVKEAELGASDGSLEVAVVSYRSLLKKLKTFFLEYLFRRSAVSNPFKAASFLKRLEKHVLSIYPHFNRKLFWAERRTRYSMDYGDEPTLHEEHYNLLVSIDEYKTFLMLQYARSLYLYAIGRNKKCLEIIMELGDFVEEKLKNSPEYPWFYISVQFARISLLSSSSKPAELELIEIKNVVYDSMNETESQKANPYFSMMRSLVSLRFHEKADVDHGKAISYARDAIDLAKDSVGSPSLLAEALLHSAALVADADIEKAIASVALAVASHANDYFIIKSASSMLASLFLDIGESQCHLRMDALNIDTTSSLGKMLEDAEYYSMSPLVGGHTKTVYNLLLDCKYFDAINFITDNKFEITRPGLSILAFCFYEAKLFSQATETAAELVKKYPESTNYRLLLAKSLAKEEKYPQAKDVLDRIIDGKPGDTDSEEVKRLRIAIAVEEGELLVAIQLLESETDSTEKFVNMGSLQLAVGTYRDALQHFRKALDADAYQTINPIILYYAALCHFYLHEYVEALDIISEVLNSLKDVANSYRDYKGESEYADGMKQMDIQTVVAALNLRSAIEFLNNDYESYVETLKELPFPEKKDYDALSFHNYCLFQIQMNGSKEAIDDLTLLLDLPECPPSTLYNLILGYYRTRDFNHSDLLAELNPQDIEPEIEGMMRALDLVDESPGLCLSSLEQLKERAFEKIEKLREIKEHCIDSLSDQSKVEYAAMVRVYKSIVFAMAHCYWSQGSFDMVESQFKRLSEISEPDFVSKIVMAHSLFYQGLKDMQTEYFTSAIAIYEPIYSEFDDEIQYLPREFLGNLCFCYLMINENQKAEDIMSHSRQISIEWLNRYKDEDQAGGDTKRVVLGQMLLGNLCYLHLIVGDLYCSIGNFHFGLLLIIKAFEFPQYTLNKDTWKWASTAILNYLLVCADHSHSLDSIIFSELTLFMPEMIEHCKEQENSTEYDVIVTQARDILAMLLKMNDTI